MVSRTKPEIFDDCVDLKTAGILFDNSKYSVSVSEDCYRNHADTEDITVYLIDFDAKREEETEFNFEIVIK